MSTNSVGQHNRRIFFNRGPGREKFYQMKNKKDVKSQKIIENQSFDTCEHELELLQSSLKWRDIRKTLHWLRRILASNRTNIQLCSATKDLRSGSNIDYHLPKTKSKKEKFFKNKKTNWAKNLTNNSETSIHSRRSKNFKKEHKKKYWKIRSKKGRNKSKQKEFQHETKYKNYSNFSPTLNATILKPNSVLFDFEKIFFKTKNENKSRQKCNESGNLAKIAKNCEIKANEEWKSKITTSSWSPEPKSGEQNRKNEAKSPKQKPWPHFVYHRVSSNFLHPELTGQSHGKSAYIAISVVNGGKSDSTDNNNI